ncbi:hypothetical protein FD755_001389 [Muntiacus reevesi]|uniref:Ig-like domain-containing protein n=1 Tax=Muntiacus reevesi TaxID=9886 RepID=A0A5J5N3B3_MUNRE|nr:hypothetical protein FD755_001389 [Muntiacus reevesi]
MGRRFKRKGHRCSAHHVVGISGEPVWLRTPGLQTNIYSVKWRMPSFSESSNYFIWSWKNDSGWTGVRGNLNLTLNHFNQRFNVISKDFTLLIKPAQPQDSGLYTLEVTNHSGKVWIHKFQVSIFDRVERPHLVEKRKVLDGDFCRVTLSCSVARGGDVSYAWYRGTELIQTRGNLTELVDKVDVSGSHLYTCNVSNPVSWANQSLQLMQGCQSDHQDVTFLFILVSVMILLVALFLGTLIYLCVRRKRKQSRTTPEVLTIYEDVNNMRTRRNQAEKTKEAEGNRCRIVPAGKGWCPVGSMGSTSEPNLAVCTQGIMKGRKPQSPEQKPPGEGKTIYSTIQSQKLTPLSGKVRPWCSWSLEDSLASVALQCLYR